jgi:CubicO group peptidase (beta-lactamase class C family)
MHALLLAVFVARSAVDDAVRLVMRTQHVAGLSIGIVHRGEIAYERGYGWSDLGKRSPARVQTIYRIGSLTKSFTAAAILTLVREHRVSLDDPVSQLVPSFPWRGEITVNDLLTHRSGIPSYSDIDALDRHRSYTPEQLVAAVASQPLLFEPGELWSYSNTNYVLLGTIVERRTGMPYQTYLQNAVLDALRLQHTKYGDQAGEARGYARDILNMPVAPSSTSFAYAAAGLSSNVPDLLRWLNVVQPPYYGFFTAHMYGYETVYATGSVNGYSSFAMIVPQTHDSIVILTNADELDLIPLAKSVFAALEPPKTDASFRSAVPAA